MQNKALPTLLALAIVSAIVVLLTILLRDGGGNDSPEAARPTATPAAANQLPVFGPHPLSPPGEGPQPLPASRVMFCVPATLLGQPRVIGLAPAHTRAVYRPGTCDPLLGDGTTVSVVDRNGAVRDVPFGRASAIDDIERAVWLPAPAPESLILTGRFISSAQVTDDAFGETVVVVEFDPEGQDLLQAITNGTVGLPMTIFINGAQLRTRDGALWTYNVTAATRGPLTFQGLDPDVALALADQLNSLLDDE